jgi:dTDP-4-amino-4,6-dideoxy-D-galactose acyltransferase
MNHLLASRSDKLFFYSPYNFIREIEKEKQLNHIVYHNLKNESNQQVEIVVEGFEHLFLFAFLDWDTNYFNLKTYKLKAVLFSHQNFETLTKAVNIFIEKTIAEQAYFFIEIPSEDILLLRALGGSGFQLIETRLTYYRGNLGAYQEPRYSVRGANINDIENLKRVAREMRNDYDRFHADSVFSINVADEFLATYIEQSLKGYTDIVLTSNENDLPSDSFLTAKYLKNDWPALGKNVSKMVLSAVSNKTNKGWYKKLISEMTYHLIEQGAEYIYMNTQSTNRAVLYTWEKLGYQLGGTTHILSYYKK